MYLFLRVHHERPVLHDGLVQRLAGDEDQARIFGCLERHAIRAGRVAQDAHALRFHLRAFYIHRAAIDVDEGVMRGRQCSREFNSCRDVDIQIQRLGDFAADCARHAVAGAGDHAHGDVFRGGVFGDRFAGKVLVPGRRPSCFVRAG